MANGERPVHGPAKNKGESRRPWDNRGIVVACLAAAVLVGVVATLLPGRGDRYTETSATAGLWALACLACGLIGGFLFGIPKVSQEPLQDPVPAVTPAGAVAAGPARPVARPGTDYTLQVNTNLEQISDWLCKIIVGIGLIELRNVPDRIDALATALSRDLGPGFSHAYAGGLIVYFLVIGFLGGFILTRLFLMREFSRADQEAIRFQLDQAAQVAAEADRVAQLVEEVRVEAGEAKERLKALDINLAVANGKIAQRASDADAQFIDFAINGLIQARRSAPADRRAAIVLGTLYAKRKQYAAALAVLDDALGAKRRANTGEDKDARDLEFNRACYYYRLFRDGTGPGEKQTALDNMYAALIVAVRDDPGNRAEAYDNEEKDFEEVWNEQQFARVVGPRLAPPAAPVIPPPPPPTPPPARLPGSAERRRRPPGP
jgi:uncharacterized protein YneF (UPF0154 family)